MGKAFNLYVAGSIDGEPAERRAERTGQMWIRRMVNGWLARGGADDDDLNARSSVNKLIRIDCLRVVIECLLQFVKPYRREVLWEGRRRKGVRIRTRVFDRRYKRRRNQLGIHWSYGYM